MRFNEVLDKDAILKNVRRQISRNIKKVHADVYSQISQKIKDGDNDEFLKLNENAQFVHLGILLENNNLKLVRPALISVSKYEGTKPTDVESTITEVLEDKELRLQKLLVALNDTEQCILYNIIKYADVEIKFKRVIINALIKLFNYRSDKSRPKYKKNYEYIFG
jgi:hypothetical protein